MTDPIVTHADLPDLEALAERAAHYSEEVLLERLLAAAKADAPTLPDKAWVLAEVDDGSHRALWRQDGRLNLFDDGGGTYYGHREFKSVTPLRPTVTEAQLDEILVTLRGLGVLPRLGALVQALAAAGIEVQP